MSLYQFIASRIAMGRLHLVAVARANASVRRLCTEDRLVLCHPGFVEWQPVRAGVLSAQQIAFRDACAMVNMHHRHHASPIGHLFSGGVFDGDVLCAAVIAGRPVARNLDDGKTVELLRVVSDGTRNGCSKAMGWAIREARKRGFSRVITYTLEDEPGGSLRAVGFCESGKSRGGSWSRPSRTRAAENHPVSVKRRWEIHLATKGCLNLIERAVRQGGNHADGN